MVSRSSCVVVVVVVVDVGFWTSVQRCSRVPPSRGTRSLTARDHRVGWA